MPCEWLTGPNGETIHINRGRSRGKLLKCRFCARNYYQAEGKLCDFPIAEGKTCDAEMCNGCSVRLGAQVLDIGSGFKKADSIDVCPDHRTAKVVNGKFATERAHGS